MGANVINHDIRSVNGKYLVMPPYKAAQEGWGNLAIPNVVLAGGDTSQAYPVNTKFVDFDRTFIYGYTYSKQSTAVKTNLGLGNLNAPAIVTWGAATGAVGDTVCPILTSTMDTYTTCAVNLFAGGYLMARTNPYGCYRIISSTVYNGGLVATETDMTIEDSLQATVTASQASCFLAPNPYTKMHSYWAAGADDSVSFVGVTLIDPIASTYQWVQTWGPVMMLGGENAGKAANLREQFFAMDGTLIAGAEADRSTTAQHQRAGFIIEYTTGGLYGPLVMLQITP